MICDSREGILAQEFPLFNYLIAGIWQVFGTSNWSFRLFNLLIASLGLFFFSKIARRFVGERAALYATVIFGVSAAFIYARKAMPDVFAVSLVLVGVEYGWRYLEQKQTKSLVLFFLFATLGILCKMPAALVLGLMAGPVFNKDYDQKSKQVLIGVGAAAVAIMAYWYFIWTPWIEKEKGFPLFYPTSISEGFKQLVEMKTDTIARFYPIALTSRLAFLSCLAGIGWMFWKQQRALMVAGGLSMVLLAGYMLKSGGTFSGHEYYVIPFVPMMSLWAGYGLYEAVKNQWLQLLLLLVIAVEAIYQHKKDFFFPWQEQKFLKLEKIVDEHIPKESRILVNNREGSPIMMYFAHRRGWTVTDRMKDSAWVAGESTVGLNYMVIERTRLKDTLPWPKIYEDNEFQIYKTKKN